MFFHNHSDFALIARVENIDQSIDHAFGQSHGQIRRIGEVLIAAAQSDRLQWNPHLGRIY